MFTIDYFIYEVYQKLEIGNISCKPFVDWKVTETAKQEMFQILLLEVKHRDRCGRKKIHHPKL